MKKLLQICLWFLTTGSVFGQSNLSFENWHPDTTNNLKLDSWRHYLGTTDNTDAGHMNGTERVTNSQSGTYALKVWRWYASAYDHVSQTAFITTKPLTLDGYYLYEDPNLVTNLAGGAPVKDTAVVTVSILKRNAVSGVTDTIGKGLGRLTEISNYTPFSVSINYSSTDMPDSINISIVPTSTTQSNVPACHDGGPCSYLTIDNLSFNRSVSVSSLNSKNDVVLHPNPITDKLYLDTRVPVNVRLINCSGTLISSTDLKAGANTLDMQTLPAGLYFIIANSFSYKITKL